MKQYQHLSAEERAVIMIERHGGRSTRGTAALLGRSAATISRELKRNGASGITDYNATAAAKCYRARRLGCGRRRKLRAGTALYQTVSDHLIYRRWSPQQIAATLRTIILIIQNSASATRRSTRPFTPTRVVA